MPQRTEWVIETPRPPSAGKSNPLEHSLGCAFFKPFNPSQNYPASPRNRLKTDPNLSVPFDFCAVFLRATSTRVPNQKSEVFLTHNRAETSLFRGGEPAGGWLSSLFRAGGDFSECLERARIERILVSSAGLLEFRTSSGPTHHEGFTSQPLFSLEITH